MSIAKVVPVFFFGVVSLAARAVQGQLTAGGLRSDNSSEVELGRA